MTKWEKFAQIKGIKNKKKSNLVFDEESGEYRPRWGYGSKNNDPLKDWLVEFPSNGKGKNFWLAQEGMGGMYKALLLKNGMILIV